MPRVVRQSYVIYELPLQQYAEDCSWEVVSLSDLATVVGGATPDTDNPALWNPGDFPWATPTDITKSDGIYITSTERRVSETGLKSCSANLLPPHSTLLTSRATIGEARMNLEPMCTNQGFASLVPKPETDPYFLLYLVELLRPCLIRLGAGTTFLEVSRREVRRVKCRVPKQRLEQEQISAVIRAADEALALTSDAPLKKLRKSLLTELMTGRVKVGSKA